MFLSLHDVARVVREKKGKKKRKKTRREERKNECAAKKEELEGKEMWLQETDKK